MIDLLDAGDVGAADFIASVYFKGTCANEFEFLYHQLATRKQRCVAVRSHAKILLFEMTNGAAYVVESSANLRSCHNIEQFALTHDAKLLAFHRGWMDTIITQALSGEPSPRRVPQ